MLGDVPVVHDEYVFIDFGSGKGRALLLASMFPFREIIGVEHSAVLTEVAKKNIQIFKDDLQACRNLTAVCHDATVYAIPPVKTVLFFNNPFDGDLMRLMVASVEKSLRDFPRSIYVVYSRPLCRDQWDRSPLFKVIKKGPTYLIYQSQS